MNKTFLTLSLILTFQVHAYAQKDNSCTDMATFTCSSIGANDGTSVGSAKSSKAEFADQLKKETFPAVQKAFIKKISSMHLDESARTAIMAKLNNLKFSTACEELSNKLDESLWPNAFYTHSDNTFYLCKAKPGMSEFVAAKMIADELSEMVNPCGIDSIVRRPKDKNLEQSESAYPVKGLISCLRSDKSVAAKRNNAAPFKVNGFCADDQITRSFSDWMTTEVVTEYISEKYSNLSSSQWKQGVANAYRGECSYGRPDDGFTDDPEFKDRINAVVAVNPALRKKIGCYDSSKYLYCDANNPDAMAKAIGVPRAANPAADILSNPSDSKGGAQ